MSRTISKKNENQNATIVEGKICGLRAEDFVNVQLPDNTQYISKITKDKNEYDTNIANSKRLASIDPQQKYFIYPVSGCVQTQNGATIYVLQMPNGGIGDLAEMYEDSNTKLDNIQAEKILENSINCLTKLHEYELFHGDIKFHNFVIDPQTQEVHMIDFDKELCDILSQNFVIT